MLLQKENTKAKNDFKNVFELKSQRDINERYVEKLVKDLKKQDLKTITPEDVVKKVKEDIERIKELNPEKVKAAVYEKLRDIEFAVTWPIVEKILIMMIYGWDAAFGPKPKK